MNRIAAVALLVFGQSLVATLDPAVALMPAFVSFLAAGTIMARSALSEPEGWTGESPGRAGGKTSGRRAASSVRS
jgi:hypothetical protein